MLFVSFKNCFYICFGEIMKVEITLFYRTGLNFQECGGIHRPPNTYFPWRPSWKAVYGTLQLSPWLWRSLGFSTITGKRRILPTRFWEWNERPIWPSKHRRLLRLISSAIPLFERRPGWLLPHFFSYTLFCLPGLTGSLMRAETSSAFFGGKKAKFF